MKKLIGLLGACLLTACTANQALRTASETTCNDMLPCSDSYYEHHPNYEIGFVEYSERGNDFAPQRTQRLLERLEKYSASGDVAMVVFVHGWKHNADQKDGNVVSFSKALANLSASGVLGKRKLVGIYVGWRGLSMHGLGTENLTYWDRKAVAEEVGRGGVTELLDRLEYIDKKDRNYLIVVGHSFGGAITLSALHDQLLGRLHNQQRDPSAAAFGDAVIMLNPAIEANQGLLLKENSLKVGATGKPVAPLLYVISSQGDTATHRAFPAGQWLGVNLTWSQVELQRTYNGVPFRLREEQMDTTAIGNYSLYRTALLVDPACPIEGSAQQAAPSPAVVEDTKMGYWDFKSYCTPDGNNADPALPRMPCYSNEPVNFIYTSKSFINDHNDIFNEQVIAFMATAVGKAIYVRTGGQSYLKQCHDPAHDKFLFSGCFDFHFQTARQTREKLEHSQGKLPISAAQPTLCSTP